MQDWNLWQYLLRWWVLRTPENQNFAQALLNENVLHELLKHFHIKPMQTPYIYIWFSSLLKHFNFYSPAFVVSQKAVTNAFQMVKLLFLEITLDWVFASQLSDNKYR